MPRVADRADRFAMPLLAGGLLLGLVARLTFAIHDDGLLWPDEYYQSLEPAHRAVFGYGWQAWEFLDGARHWTLPGFVALIIKVAAALGVDYLAAVEATFCGVGVLTAAAVYRLARAQDVTPFSAAVASATFACMGLAVYVAPRAMGESLSALPVTLAFALLFRPGSRGFIVSAGLLLAFAVGLRLQNGLFCVGAFALLWTARRRNEAWLLFGVLVVGALLYGAVDWATWGAPFHSARQYLRFNLLEGKSSSFGTHPFFLYVRALVTAEGLTMVPLLALAAYGARLRTAVPAIALVFLFVHSCIPHKELRFVFPIIPLIAAQAAVGLDRLGARRAWAGAAVVLLALASLATLHTLTFWRLGISNPSGALSAIDYGGPENRLLRKVGQLEDLCGLKIEGFEWWRTGGFAYLHRPVPMYGPRPGDGHYNYVIAPRGRTDGAVIATDGDVALLKLDTPCTPDPAYDWHLE